MKKLTALRIARGHRSQLSIAQESGLWPSRYNEIENGHARFVPPDVAQKIADVLNKPVQDLFLPSGFSPREVEAEDDAGLTDSGEGAAAGA